MSILDRDDIDYLIELRGVYDGWSIAVLKDGTMLNRWADEDGRALAGYKDRFERTQKAIKEGNW